MLRSLGVLEHQREGDMALSNFSKVLQDIYYDVRGIIRKRARHRCIKRGQDWDAYEKPIRDAQRIIGEKVAQEIINNLVFTKNPFLALIKTYTPTYVYFPFPIKCNPAKRKRSQHRH